jgi:hypothetical protein
MPGAPTGADYVLYIRPRNSVKLQPDPKGGQLLLLADLLADLINVLWDRPQKQ